MRSYAQAPRCQVGSTKPAQRFSRISQALVLDAPINGKMDTRRSANLSRVRPKKSLGAKLPRRTSRSLRPSHTVSHQSCAGVELRHLRERGCCCTVRSLRRSPDQNTCFRIRAAISLSHPPSHPRSRPWEHENENFVRHLTPPASPDDDENKGDFGSGRLAERTSAADPPRKLSQSEQISPQREFQSGILKLLFQPSCCWGKASKFSLCP